MSDHKNTIYYTFTDEAPMLATVSLLPVIQTFTNAAGIEVKVTDISLAGRILSAFPDYLEEGQQVEDGLAFLGKLTQDPGANIIKLPNISASVPQLKACIKELQSQGYKVPDYPENPANEKEQEIHDRYSKILGSAVNPVLREGNSDRRAPKAVKNYARKYPHSMGYWSKASQTHADWMRDGDFFSSEQSVTVEDATDVRLEFVNQAGEVEVKKTLSLEPGEILDSMRMSVKKLRAFFEETLEDCKKTGVMWSLHVKATMMKISHPIVFGHAVTVFYKDVFDKHGELFRELGVNPNNGISDVYTKIKSLPYSKLEELLEDLHAVYEHRPDLAMVDSVKRITNLHVPSDVIVDASMPAMIRNGGKMWGKDGKPKDVKAVMPERTYARIYQEIINFCKTHGAFDPTKIGTVPNVGLMARKAEEYGSNDKTWEMQADGIMRVVRADTGEVLMQHDVEKGDIWRACQTKDDAVQDWVKLAVTRSRLSGMPAVFWLDDERAHDRNLIAKVERYLKDHDTEGLDIRIMNYEFAMRYTLERMIRGKDTISVTGNILRDYLTDLFPIIELGTSAKMLSIVPMLKGGCMYETGAGGSAPRHVQQVQEENHLRWDSLGEFLALTVALEDMARKHGIKEAGVLGDALDRAVERMLEENKAPSRKTGELDNRGSHFWLALYWAQEVAKQTEEPALAKRFAALADRLETNREKILEEMSVIQGHPADLDGYYHPSWDSLVKVMRPSATFNRILEEAMA